MYVRNFFNDDGSVDFNNDLFFHVSAVCCDRCDGCVHCGSVLVVTCYGFGHALDFDYVHDLNDRIDYCDGDVRRTTKKVVDVIVDDGGSTNLASCLHLNNLYHRYQMVQASGTRSVGNVDNVVELLVEIVVGAADLHWGAS